MSPSLLFASGRLLGLVAVVLCASVSSVHAGGLFLPFHGVRGMGRGGAFVAGADDPGGIWYNPATIDRASRPQILLDGAMVLYKMAYTRVDSGGNLLPTVKNENVPMPIPTIAVAAPVWGERLWVGGSFSAGTGVLPSYPRPSYGICDPTRPMRCIDSAHYDAPQRYSLVSFEGTFFLRLDLAVAYRVTKWFTVGASLQNVIGRMQQVKAISSFNGTLSSGPEDPDYDSLIDVRMTSIFNPTGQLGLTLRPHEMVTIGLSLQLPLRITSDAQLAVQLPVSPLYAASTVSGSSAKVSLDFPLMLAAGVEVRPLPGLRLEADVVFENWGSVDSIRFTPKDIEIRDLPGIGTYRVPETYESLGYQSTISLRLGGEYALPFHRPLVLRAGYGFETGATPIEHTSLVSADFKKHVLSLGASYRLSRFRFDLGFAVVMTPQRYVSPETSKAPQINPINPTGAVNIGGGTYDHSFVVLGLGLNVTL